jgi:hypothetical protein
MHRLTFLLLVLLAGTLAVAQDNPLKKSSRDDWAKYLITTKNETVPLMSGKDRPHWRIVSDVGEDFVRVDNFTTFSGRRVGGGGFLCYFKDPYEPVPGLGKTTKAKVVSSSKDKLTVNGKQYNCTKVVRKIERPLDESVAQSSWIGTSTIWICDDVPLGLVKMVNDYKTTVSKSDKGQKLLETWVLAEWGFKNWKEN